MMQPLLDPSVVLNNLLRESVAAAEEREKGLLDHLTTPFGRQLVLFGAGSLGKKILEGLRKESIEPRAFSDNNPSLWGKRVGGIEVIAPQEASHRFGDKAAFVVTIWSPGHQYLRTRQQLASLGCQRVVPFLPMLWKYPHALLPHYCFDLPHRLIEDAHAIWTAFQLLHDTESRLQFVAHLRLRLLADYDGLPKASPGDQYFPEDIISLSPNEVFVDGGAYDGDTLLAFLARTGGRYERAIAIEPDPHNYVRLCERVRGLENEGDGRLEVINLALASRHGVLRFNASGCTGAAFSDQGATQVECAPIDYLLASKPATFIKLDIEGAELDALAGARQTICNSEPTIATCVYHHPGDLWQIPTYLSSLKSHYRFFLRQHGDDGSELVLYAVSEDQVPPRVITFGDSPQ